MTRLNLNADIQSIAVRMVKNGIDIAIFPKNEIPEIVESFVRVKFKPKISSWN